MGRTAELATVRSLVDGVRRGRGGVLLVGGEAGIGKTRLLREVAERARDAGLAVVSGRAVEGSGTYRPLAEALADQLREAAPAFFRGASCQAVLGQLLPGWTGDGGRPLSVDLAVRIGEAALALLREAGGDHGCLMVLDDMHWADADTLAVVEYLAGAVRGRPILVALAACDDEPLPGVLSRLTRREEVTALRSDG